MGNVSSWSDNIPYDTFKEYVILMMSNNQPLVSVGSGLGLNERRLETDLNINILCIDPKPHSFNNQGDEKKCHMPDYSLVDDLIKEKADLIGNCNLMLCWPYPNESTYDIEAIVKLKPSSVLIVYESLGGAGGNQLHNWLEKINAPNGSMICKLQHNYVDDINDTYNVIQLYKNGNDRFDSQTFCMVLVNKQT